MWFKIEPNGTVVKKKKKKTFYESNQITFQNFTHHFYNLLKKKIAVMPCVLLKMFILSS